MGSMGQRGRSDLIGYQYLWSIRLRHCARSFENLRTCFRAREEELLTSPRLCSKLTRTILGIVLAYWIEKYINMPRIACLQSSSEIQFFLFPFFNENYDIMQH